MAHRGRPPKPPELKLVTGNPGKRPIVAVSGKPKTQLTVRTQPLEPPRKLTRAQRQLWDRFVNTAWWLTDHDVPKAFAWVCLQAEFATAPAKMVAARITQLRVLGSELGFDPAGRARIGAERKRQDPARRFFDD